ncbi:hypothetical protein ACIHCQ_41275 [Streptomyces sp. NPDC052236]|uniref:hypothetical protein n=1 Tax=Streptomyces sp. NPDC052236 TaxID=3365686 RepID=UPI0037D029EA
MTDKTPGMQARELLTRAAQHPLASPQRTALVAEAAVWAALEQADSAADAADKSQSAAASLKEAVDKLGSEVGELTERIKLSQL